MPPGRVPRSARGSRTQRQPANASFEEDLRPATTKRRRRKGHRRLPQAQLDPAVRSVLLRAPPLAPPAGQGGPRPARSCSTARGGRCQASPATPAYRAPAVGGSRAQRSGTESAAGRNRSGRGHVPLVEAGPSRRRGKAALQGSGAGRAAHGRRRALLPALALVKRPRESRRERESFIVMTEEKALLPLLPPNRS